jgi:DNA helicase II / ATP-dependent DNA helicase PcrA
MGKEVVFAVAGSGKTTRIVEELSAGRRCLVLTYTEENADTLRRKIIGRYGRIPPGVKVMTYFTFLHSFCFRPLIGLKLSNRGLGFSNLPAVDRFRQTDDRYYLDASRRLYHGRLAKLIQVRDLMGEVLERVDEFFDIVCIDEVQDFGGNDFNFILKLAGAKADLLLVGDFRQHTYDTSRDHGVNKTLHAKFEAYAQRFRDAGIVVDTESLSLSRRCSPAVCEFISERLGIAIRSSTDRVAAVVEVQSQSEADVLWRRNDIVKLFYSEHAAYGCASQNWGASKGDDHHDEVCVVLNPTTLKAYKEGKLHALSPLTLNRLYVALLRSRGNVYLVSQTYMKRYKFK